MYTKCNVYTTTSFTTQRYCTDIISLLTCRLKTTSFSVRVHTPCSIVVSYNTLCGSDLDEGHPAMNNACRGLISSLHMGNLYELRHRMCTYRYRNASSSPGNYSNRIPPQTFDTHFCFWQNRNASVVTMLSMESNPAAFVWHTLYLVVQYKYRNASSSPGNMWKRILPQTFDMRSYVVSYKNYTKSEINPSPSPSRYSRYSNQIPPHCAWCTTNCSQVDSIGGPFASGGGGGRGRGEEADGCTTRGTQ